MADEPVKYHLLWQFWEPGERRIKATQAGWMRRPELELEVEQRKWWMWEAPDGTLVSAPANTIPVIWRSQ
jgi:hypothetical protein